MVHPVWEERRPEYFAPIFSVLVAVSEGSIDPSPRRPLSPSSPSKKAETQRIEEKKKRMEKVLGRGEEKSKYERDAAGSQRKMDFREVRAGLNSRKMSQASRIGREYERNEEGGEREGKRGIVRGILGR